MATKKAIRGKKKTRSLHQGKKLEAQKSLRKAGGHEYPEYRLNAPAVS